MDYTKIPPETKIVDPRCAPFFHNGSRESILLLHGYTGTPYDMRYLAERLSQQDYAVFVPRLPGHGTNRRDFLQSKDDDWLREAIDGYLTLQAMGKPVHVCGLSMGGVLALLLVLPRMTTMVPAVLVAVVGATIASAVFDLAASDVTTVGVLPQGIPTPTLPFTSWSDVVPLLVGAVGTTMVSLADTIATSSGFAARHNEEVDANQEMVGIGTANIAAGFFQGFAVSVSGSRTAVADQAGAKSQVTGLVGAGLVAALLLFLNGLLADLPQTALAAVVITAALSLMDLGALRRYASIRPSSLVISLVAAAGVILLGVLQGIVVAIVLAVLLFFRRNWWPHGAVLGEVPELGGWHSVTEHPSATQLPDIVVFRWEAPLFFANAGQFRDQVRRLVREQHPGWVVLQCEAVTDIDVTAAEVLRDLDEEVNAAGVHLAFVEMRDRLQSLVKRYGLHTTLDEEHFYPSLERALADITSAAAEGSVTDRPAGQT